MRTVCLIGAITGLCLVFAWPGVCAGSDVVLGMTAPFTGPAKDLGEAMREGISAAIDEANKRAKADTSGLLPTYRLIALDDGYEPERAAANVRTLIKEHDAIALVGCVGTPTAVASIPIAIENKTLFFGAFTGAGVLRKSPPDRYVVNFRASYAEETGQMVDALIAHTGLKPEEIGFFTQRDAYGDAGFAGGVAALKRHGLVNEASILHGRYERNTDAVENGLADLITTAVAPKAVIMVGAYRPCAKFVRLARENGLIAPLLNVSFVGSSSLLAECGSAGEGIIVTQVVPSPDVPLPLCDRYRAALKASNPDALPGYGSLEGYASMQVLFKAFEKAGADRGREALVSSLLTLGEFDLGIGVPLHLGEKQTQASHTVWPTVFRSGRIVPFEWKALKSGTFAGAEK